MKENESQKCDQADQQVNWHYERAMAMKSFLSCGFAKQRGHLTAEVFLRATGAVRKDKTYIIQEQDIYAWFENGDHLKIHTEYDKL